jgi:hypothetical protein
MWWKGPDWLGLPESNNKNKSYWPDKLIVYPPTDEDSSDESNFEEETSNDVTNSNKNDSLQDTTIESSSPAGGSAVQSIANLKNLALVICLLLNIIGVFGGPMICPDSNNNKYWRINKKNFPCANFSTDYPQPIQHRFKIFKLNTDLVKINAANCTIVNKTIEYRTDLINNRHTLNYYETLAIDARECTNMWINRVCKYGNLNGEISSIDDIPENGQTNNEPDVQFSYGA